MSLAKSCSFILSTKAQLIILVIIFLNAISLGIETSKTISPSLRSALDCFDSLALGIYVLELSLKHVALGFRFWKSGWNVFDFIIVAISFVPAGSSLSILRGLRILRVLRLVSSIRPLKRIVVGLLQSIPGIGWLTVLVMINFYLFAVIGTNFFGEKFPEFFGTIGASSYTLFQIMTLESWSMGIARPVTAQFEYAYIYFIIFILLNTFVMLNLFVGIIVSAMSSIEDSEAEDKKLKAQDKAAREEGLRADKASGADLSDAMAERAEVLAEVKLLREQLEVSLEKIAELEGRLQAPR
ncbi:MAG: ion transporter [Succinivibrio sp.]|nr:ion transporter [Succinivibrio sp.]